MRHLFAVLITAAILVVTFVVYVLLCWLISDRPTLAGFTFILVVNIMFLFYDEYFK